MSDPYSMLHLDHTVTLVDPRTGATLWLGSIGQFIADNEFDEDEAEDIHGELTCNGHYYGGGGASPEWVLYAKLLPETMHGAAKLSRLL